MGVTRKDAGAQGARWNARHRLQTKSFSVSKYGEEGAKRLAEETFASYGITTRNGRAFKATHCNKKYDLVSNFSFFWETSASTDKLYPYLLVSFIPDDGERMTRTVKRSLARHGIKNTVVRLCKLLVDAGYPTVSEAELDNKVRSVLLSSHATRNFDLALIPDFY